MAPGSAKPAHRFGIFGRDASLKRALPAVVRVPWVSKMSLSPMECRERPAIISAQDFRSARRASSRAESDRTVIKPFSWGLSFSSMRARESRVSSTGEMERSRVAGLVVGL